MKLLDVTPILYTTQIKETIDFYVNNLGFVCKSFDEGWGWASLQRDDVCIMLTLPNEHTPFDKPTFTGSIYLSTDNVDELWNTLKDTVRICYPVEDFEYGMREFAIYDNNGYLLQFGQELQPP